MSTLSRDSTLFINSKTVIIVTFLVSFMLLTCADLLAATYYMPDDFPNLRAACVGIRGGDTLIIRDGSYSGSNNVLNKSFLPPSGTADNYTVIRAENDGGAVFPDGFIFMEGWNPNQYISYEGLKSEHLTAISGANHVKFLRCAFTCDLATQSSNSVFVISGSSYILVEDCWAWGAGRYKFLAYGNNDGDTHHIVFRRCVSRFDRVNSGDPMANFSIYRANYVALQNCIGIDGDHDEFWTSYYERGPVFYSHHGSRNTKIDSCIGINNKNFFIGDWPNTGFDVKNCVTWDCDSGICAETDRGDPEFYTDGFSVDHCTIGNMTGAFGGVISGRGVYVYEGVAGSIDVTNTILYDINGGSALRGSAINGSSSDYNVLYNNDVDYNECLASAHDYSAANSNAVNPSDGTPGNGKAALMYPVRIENGSNLDGTGSDGGDRGANILYRVGVSGTYWGDTGWDTVTSEPLWPWPNEDCIRSDMRAYSYTGTIVGGGTDTLSGARGFCADGQTLTKYIWEYLGNSIPPEIYGTPQQGNQSPHADAGADQNLSDTDGDNSEMVSLDASASYDPDGSIMSYVWSENGSQVAAGVNPTITLDVGTHLLSLVVTDNYNAASTDEVRIEIDPAEGDQTPPVISNVKTLNVASRSATISWDTNEPSASKVLYGITSSYGQEVENVALVTNHEVILSGLEPSSTYHFQVISKDGNNNEASSADYTFTTQSEGTTFNTLQDFEDSVVWIPGGSQDPTGNGRGWAFLSSGTGDKIEIDNIGANGSSNSLKLTFASSNDQIYFRSNDKITDHMPEAQGANRMSFYVRFPEGFPIQPLPFRYDTWQFGTFIHDPDNWSDTHSATSESDHGIHHYYHRVTIERVGDGWVKYIFNTHPDQANYSGSDVPPDIPYYYDSFGRFYFHFGQAAGGPEPSRPFTIWIDEIKFYYDDGTVGGQVHDGGQDDVGFDGQFIPDSSSDTTAPGDVSGFTATSGPGQITLSWTNPTDIDFAGVMIRYRTDGTNPQNKDDGLPIPNGNDGKIAGSLGQNMSYVHTNLDPTKHYYYSAFSYDTSNNYSQTAYADARPLSPNAPVIQSFTAIPSSLNNPGESTTFNVSATDLDGDSLTYTINFGDGTANGSGSEVVHTYAEQGTYTATATVNDGNGNTVAESLQVPVNDIRPAEPTNVSAN